MYLVDVQSAIAIFDGEEARLSLVDDPLACAIISIDQMGSEHP